MGYIYESAEKFAAKRKAFLKAYKKENREFLNDLYSKITNGAVMVLREKEGVPQKYVIFCLGREVLEALNFYKLRQNAVCKIWSDGDCDYVTRKELINEIIDYLSDGYTDVFELEGYDDQQWYFPKASY